MFSEDVTRATVNAPQIATHDDDDMAEQLAAQLWTSDDICQIYVRLINMGLFDPELVPLRLMNYYGERLGHYVRAARFEKEARAARVREMRA